MTKRKYPFIRTLAEYIVEEIDEILDNPDEFTKNRERLEAVDESEPNTIANIFGIQFEALLEENEDMIKNWLINNEYAIKNWFDKQNR